jgi:hypothetical protein
MRGNLAAREAIVHHVVILGDIRSAVLLSCESFFGNNSAGVPYEDALTAKIG